MDNARIALEKSRHHVFIDFMDTKLVRLEPFAESGYRVQMHRHRGARKSLVFDSF
jgi:hypothetical protein